MPPRPNDRVSARASARDDERTSTPPEIAKQGSQSYDISSQGEEEDDFIGDDSYDGSPQGSWDSSGKGGGNGREIYGGLSSAAESLDNDDDGFIRQDSSSGGDDNEGKTRWRAEEEQEGGAAATDEFRDQRAGQGQPGSSGHPGSYSGDDDEEPGGSRDSEGEGDYNTGSRQPASDATEQLPRSEPVSDAPASQASGVRSRTSASAPDRYEDQFEEDADDADSGGARPPQKYAHKELGPEYSFEEEPDGDAAMSGVAPSRGGVDAGAECGPGWPVAEPGASDTTPARSVSSAANAQAYMQSRLSMHLLAVDSEDDDDATPRLPSLSARERERRQEHELLMRTAQEARHVSNVSASDEDAVTLRLERRHMKQEEGVIEKQQDNEEDSTPRISSVLGGDANEQPGNTFAHHDRPEVANDASVRVAEQVVAIMDEADASDEIRACADTGDAKDSLNDILENVAMRVVIQAISDAGGRVVPAFLVQGGPEIPDSQVEKTRETTSSGEAHHNAKAISVPEQPQETHAVEKSDVLEGIDSSGGDFVGQRETTTDQNDEGGEDQVPGALRAQEKMDIQELQPTTNVGVHVDEDLQTMVAPDLYLIADKYERPEDGKYERPEDGRMLAKNSVRLEMYEEERPIRPSSRVNSRPSTTASVTSNQPRAETSNFAHKTRIQMRSAQQEVSHESSQGSHDGLRQRSSGAGIALTASQENLFLGRPDWNFETVKCSRSAKEKNRYESPLQVPGSKWVRNGKVSPQKSLSSQASTSFADLPQMQSSVETMSGEEKDIQSEGSKVSVTARAKEYWANNVLMQDRRKRTRRQRRPGTSQSQLGSYESDEDGMLSKRPGTTDGYASRFRYNVQGVRGGALGRDVRKDDVDWKIRDASTKPGPIYNVARQNSTPVNGGKMLESFDAVGSASWEFKKRKNLPGPGQYDRDLNEPLQTGGGRFSHENRWQQTQVFEQRSSQLPGPSEYDAGDSRDRANKRVVGGVISDAQVKNELDWTLIRSSRTPGPSSYELPPLATTKIRTKGGKGSREARLKPIYTTSASSPGPGAYFKESVSEIQNEISMRRTASRNSVATSRSRASLGREKSQDMPPYTGRRTYLDEVQNHSAKTPGPAHYDVDSHTVRNKVSRQVLDRDWSISAPGSSDPVVYSIGQAERSSIVSDYRAIKSLQRSWADSANQFKTLLESFVSSRVRREASELSPSAPLQDTSVLSPIYAENGDEDTVFLTQEH